MYQKFEETSMIVAFRAHCLFKDRGSGLTYNQNRILPRWSWQRSLRSCDYSVGSIALVPRGRKPDFHMTDVSHAPLILANPRPLLSLSTTLYRPYAHRPEPHLAHYGYRARTCCIQLDNPSSCFAILATSQQPLISCKLSQFAEMGGLEVCPAVHLSEILT